MFSERDTVHCPTGDSRVRRKSPQFNRRADCDCPSEPSGTTTQVDEDYFAWLGKRMNGVETVEGDRNRTRNPSAAPRRSFLY